ncbi:MAG: hypothetical protein HN742_20165 [Lentisphaerae bacterium]|nr:hypothetical protein [Lentisphaerota bacterium]MBT4817075.1 hypothetical protein [Lentisphaerota bacterium]MBT5604930.1 hypothetical protein [Lentisphaerota bacterium]MBT7054524.1 hypothetical protein [Lentisphaerota bacterium]MBT7844207.1 hypothetical protein [Lentisphaerota bacterium]
MMSCFAGERITAYRKGNEYWVKSSFSAEKEIIIHRFQCGGNNSPNEAAYLVPEGTPIVDYGKGERIHRNGDELPAFPALSHATLGGNHGSPFAREMLVPGHGLDVSAIGRCLTDGTGTPFYVVKVIDADRFLIHPESARFGYPKFKALRKDAKLFWPDGGELKYEEAKVTQLWPGNRFSDYRLLVDGKTPLPDQTEVECEFLDHVLDYSVIMPDSLVDTVKNNPGKETDFLDKGLLLLFSVNTLLRYQGYGACTVDVTVRAENDFGGLRCLGVMFGWGGGSIAQKETEEFYIPKLKSITAPSYGPEKITYNCDFSAIYRMPKPWPVNYDISKADCLDPEDMPDRFIRVVGNDRRELGIAIGYSLFEGCTAKELKSADRPVVYHLWRTKKMYPYCYRWRDAKKGESRRVLAYRQYFNPQREPDATAFYYHKQMSSDIVYLDVHKSLENKVISLPQEYAGKTVTILEKTPSVELHVGEIIPASGAIALSVSDDYGYVVLKLD